MRRVAFASSFFSAATGALRGIPGTSPTIFKESATDLGALLQDSVHPTYKARQEVPLGKVREEGAMNTKLKPGQEKAEQSQSGAEKLEEAKRKIKQLMEKNGNGKALEGMWEKVKEELEKNKGDGKQGAEFADTFQDMAKAMKDFPQGKEGAEDMLAAGKEWLNKMLEHEKDKKLPLFMMMGDRETPLSVFMNGKNQVWVSFDPENFDNEVKQYKPIVEKVAQQVPDHNFLYYNTTLHRERMEEALGCVSQPCLSYIHLDGSIKDDWEPPVRVYPNGLTEQEILKFVVDAKAGRIAGHTPRLTDNVYDDDLHKDAKDDDLYEDDEF